MPHISSKRWHYAYLKLFSECYCYYQRLRLNTPLLGTTVEPSELLSVPLNVP